MSRKTSQYLKLFFVTLCNHFILFARTTIIVIELSYVPLATGIKAYFVCVTLEHCIHVT